MSMSFYVQGFAPPDEKWKKMKAVWDACEAAGVEVPHDVSLFFDHERPRDSGIKVDLRKITREFRDHAEEGIEIRISDLPEHVQTIRFVIAY